MTSSSTASAPDDFLLVINAGTREKDFNWVRDAAQSFDCAVENLSDAYTQIAIQGPNGWRTLQKLTDADLTKVKFYWFTHGTVCGLPNTLIARTGYTAEDGFEIYIPSDEPTSLRVWNELLAAGEEFGILPCGLGARNTLRLEGALSLYGHEISDTITPGRPVSTASSRWTKATSSDATPSPVRSRRGPKTILVGLEAIERGIPRDGYHVTAPDGRPIGYVTSGSPAPFLKKNIALAYVPLEYSAEGTELGVECRNSIIQCKVVPTPFYKRPKRPSLEEPGGPYADAQPAASDAAYPVRSICWQMWDEHAVRVAHSSQFWLEWGIDLGVAFVFALALALWNTISKFTQFVKRFMHRRPVRRAIHLWRSPWPIRRNTSTPKSTNGSPWMAPPEPSASPTTPRTPWVTSSLSSCPRSAPNSSPVKPSAPSSRSKPSAISTPRSPAPSPPSTRSWPPRPKRSTALPTPPGW